MEVASPLSFAPTTAGTKRSLACSPQQLLNTPNRKADMDVADESMQRSTKRRRFHADTSVDSLSEHFSSHSPFFSGKNKSIFGAQSLKRTRSDAPSPVQQDLNRVVEEQAAVIESLKTDKSKLESTVVSLKSDNEKVVKENTLLRRAVTIQQERQNQADNELKAAHQYRTESEEQIKKLEQMILSLRYHLQAQQSTIGNDFMSFPPRPPDVF